MSIMSIGNTAPYNNINNKPSFRGQSAVAKPSTFISLSTRAALGAQKVSKFYNENIIENILAKKLIAPMMNSKMVGKIAEKTSKIENMPEHMATTGSCITTLTYAGTTLHKAQKKDLEKKPAYTLALNQVLVTVLSTIGGYTINDGIAATTKKIGYKFRDLNQNHPNIEKRMKGFKTAQKLLTFSLMYRYVAPVIVTPIASKIGKALNNNEKQPKSKGYIIYNRENTPISTQNLGLKFASANGGVFKDFKGQTNKNTAA